MKGAPRAGGPPRAAVLLSLLALMLGGIALQGCAQPATSSLDQGTRPPAIGRAVAIPSPSFAPGGRHRMLLGAYTGLSGEVNTEIAVEQREAAMGRRYDLEVTYYDWTEAFPDWDEATIAAHGRTLVMTWYGPGKDPGDHHTLRDITDGRDDAWILRQARAIRDFGKPVYLRPMIEMNGNWYPGFSGNPAAFIAAWRRIHSLFAMAGAHNVIWVWCPNLEPDNWDSYYPGDSYVDVIGVDGYDWPTNPWKSFGDLFGPFLRHFAGRKPLMVGETASDSSQVDAATYIAGMRAYLKEVAGPQYGVIAVCWFDSDTDAHHLNWRVDQTPAAWRAWLALARDPYFGGHGPAG